MIGTGVFSVAIAYNLAQNPENEIILWSENQDLVTNYQKTNQFTTIFKEKVFPKNIKLTTSYEEALKEAKIVFLMTSIPYLETVCKEIKGKLDKKIPICIGTKGIYGAKPKFVHEIASTYLKNPIGLLGGPTFAKDVLTLDPLAFTIATKSKKVKKALQEAFKTSKVKLAFTKELTGEAICSGFKNAYAIGSGILEGLGYKESTLSYYVTLVFNELNSILYDFHLSNPSILYSFAGLGDLLATCTTKESRNYTFGTLLGKKESQENQEHYKKENTIEGLETLENAQKLLTKKKIKAPLFMVLYQIVFEGKNPENLIEEMEKIRIKF